MPSNPLSPSQLLGIDETHLVALESLGDTSRFKESKLQIDAAKAFFKMRNAALQDGIKINIVSSFRSFDRQLHIFNCKMRGQRQLLDIDDQPIEFESLSQEQKLMSVLLWSALPGLSRHHWGTDIDIADGDALEKGHKLELVTSEYEGDGPCSRVKSWLGTNSEAFGFYFPYDKFRGGVGPEPWHISYRPLADICYNSLTESMISKQLAVSDIEAKSLALEKLPEIFQKFFLNVNQADSL